MLLLGLTVTLRHGQASGLINIIYKRSQGIGLKVLRRGGKRRRGRLTFLVLSTNDKVCIYIYLTKNVIEIMKVVT